MFSTDDSLPCVLVAVPTVLLSFSKHSADPKRSCKVFSPVPMYTTPSNELQPLLLDGQKLATVWLFRTSQNFSKSRSSLAMVPSKHSTDTETIKVIPTFFLAI